jgi:hypothetical protein
MAALTGPEVVRERVREQLGRITGAVTAGNDGAFIVSRGGHVAVVQVVALQPDVTLVVVYAVVATNVVQVDAACRFLATRDLDLPLVHFELVADGKAFLAAHGLLGEFVSGPELVAAIDAVADAAGMLRPLVVARFGGNLLGLDASVGDTTPDWLYQPVRSASAAQPPADRARLAPSRRRVILAVTSVGALVAAAWVLWGAGSALAVVLVLGPLAAALLLRRTP